MHCLYTINHACVFECAARVCRGRGRTWLECRQHTSHGVQHMVGPPATTSHHPHTSPSLGFLGSVISAFTVIHNAPVHVSYIARDIVQRRHCVSLHGALRWVCDSIQYPARSLTVSRPLARIVWHACSVCSPHRMWRFRNLYHCSVNSTILMDTASAMVCVQRCPRGGGVMGVTVMPTKTDRYGSHTSPTRPPDNTHTHTHTLTHTLFLTRLWNPVPTCHVSCSGTYIYVSCLRV